MNRFQGSMLAACVAMVSSTSVLAGSPPGSFYITPEIIGSWLDDDRSANDDAGFAFSIGKVLSEKWDAEFTFYNSNHDAGNNNELTLQGLFVNAHRVFYRDAKVQPFLKLGFGVSESRPSGASSEQHLAAAYGVGLLADLARRPESGTNLQLRGEIYGRSELQESELTDERFEDFVAGIGLQYSWGAPVVRAVETRTVGDADGDGVTDDIDQCPNTPAGAVVDARGCELDADGDGVVDRLDKCPGTPAGATVDAVGCELDSDGDGVVDRLDQCPNTPRGEKVDAVGCPFTLRLEVNFDNDSSVIKPESATELDRALGLLRNDPVVRGRIEGHTDSVGSDAYNQKLSQRRADAVREYFVARGIDTARLNAVGLGEGNPIADNSTPEGRAENRRVLLVRTDGTK